MIEYVKNYHKKECDVQYALYSCLREEGVECELEYRHEDCIFDIAVTKGKQIVLIIETKKASGQPDYLSEQLIKYQRFSVPVVIVGSGLRYDRVAIAIRQFVSIDKEGEKYYNRDVHSYLLNRLNFTNTIREFVKSPKRSQKQKKVYNRITETQQVTRHANKQRMAFRPEK